MYIVLKQPERHYSVSQTNGVLEVTTALDTYWYYMGQVFIYEAICFTGLLVFVFMRSSLSLNQWIAVLGLGILTISIVPIFAFLLGKKYTFDPARDRVQIGNKTITSIGNIEAIRIEPAEQKLLTGRDLWYCLFLIFKQGKPHLMFRQKDSQSELLLIGDAIAKFIEVRLVQK